MGVAHSRARMSKMAAARICVTETSGFATLLLVYEACEEDVGYLATVLADHHTEFDCDAPSRRGG
jgi:hypothetical protein